MKLELLLEDFCHHSKYIRGVSENTVKRYKQKVGFFITSMGIATTDEVNQRTVHAFFMYGRSEKKWKASSYRTYHMSLLVFLRYGVKLGYFEENYADHIEVPKLEKSLPKALKKDEAYRILEYAKNIPYTQSFVRYRNHALFAVFLYAGLRKSEALNLKLADVDLENRTLFVRQGKGNKDRIIPMSFTLVQILKTYFEERTKQKKTCIQFFVCSNRDRGFNESGLKLITNRLKQTTKIDFNIHKLRHTFATLMVEGGCDIFSLSKMLGHSDIKTTTIYLSASAKHLRSQVMKHPLNSLELV